MYRVNSGLPVSVSRLGVVATKSKAERPQAGGLRFDSAWADIALSFFFFSFLSRDLWTRCRVTLWTAPRSETVGTADSAARFDVESDCGGSAAIKYTLPFTPTPTPGHLGPVFVRKVTRDVKLTELIIGPVSGPVSLCDCWDWAKRGSGASHTFPFQQLVCLKNHTTHLTRMYTHTL